jgi:hypothetical protein
MNGLEQINEIHDMCDFLFAINGACRLDWKGLFQSFTEISSWCALELTAIKKTREHRSKEADQKIRRLPSKLLREKINEELDGLHDEMQVNPNANISYYPGKIEKDIYFRDNNAREYILRMLEEGFRLPDDLGDDLELAINCSLGLVGAFWALHHNHKSDKEPFLVILNLFETLNVLSDGTKTLVYETEKIERLGDQSSRNSSKQTENRLDDYKNHPSYPRLEQMIRSYQGEPKELREINKLMQTIISDTAKKKGAGNIKISRVTIRHYRHLLFQEIQSG